MGVTQRLYLIDNIYMEKAKHFFKPATYSVMTEFLRALQWFTAHVLLGFGQACRSAAEAGAPTNWNPPYTYRGVAAAYGSLTIIDTSTQQAQFDPSQQFNRTVPIDRTLGKHLVYVGTSTLKCGTGNLTFLIPSAVIQTSG
ncbi:hypothetical protein ON010_g1948 [Phytophthora cinnamomi]|nr:hypothetical protein ON010_g1948 [Phytophthora cinnamomi]